MSLAHRVSPTICYIGKSYHSKRNQVAFSYGKIAESPLQRRCVHSNRWSEAWEGCSSRIAEYSTLAEASPLARPHAHPLLWCSLHRPSYPGRYSHVAFTSFLHFACFFKYSASTELFASTAHAFLRRVWLAQWYRIVPIAWRTNVSDMGACPALGLQPPRWLETRQEFLRHGR